MKQDIRPCYHCGRELHFFKKQPNQSLLDGVMLFFCSDCWALFEDISIAIRERHRIVDIEL